MITIKDRTFNLSNFKKIIDYLDTVVLFERMCEKDVIYDVKNSGQNYMGYIHKVRVLSESDKGFSLYLYEDQTLKTKGFLCFRVDLSKANKVQIKEELVNFGCLHVEFKKVIGGYHFVVAYLSNLDDVEKIITKYRSHIF